GGGSPADSSVARAAARPGVEGRVGAARAAGGRGDRLVLLHSPRGTRDALRRDRRARAEGIAVLDETLVGPLAAATREAGGRLLVVCDRARDTATGRALRDPVPALLWGAGIPAIRSLHFDEAGAAAAGAPLEPGHGLLAYVRNL
ncbi:MAG: hypothetical protein ACE5JG_12605, partial [Planctomycetota bacterium]